jgi:biopolymer transport protein ExbB
MDIHSTWSTPRCRRALAALGVVALAVAAFVAVSSEPTSSALAQEKGPAAGAAKGGVAAPAADGEAKPIKQQKSFLMWLYTANGPYFTVAFLAISFWFVALVVQHLMGLRRDNIVPLQLVEVFEAHLNEKKYQEAYELAKADESFLGQVLSAGLARLSAGYEKAVESMQETGEEEVMKLEHRLSGISVVAVISPMVGLLGTVWGMILAFETLATSGGAPKPDELAQNIGMALVTTLIGLIIAIPALMFHNAFKNRIAKLVHEVGIVSEGLMSRFETVGKKAPSLT